MIHRNIFSLTLAATLFFSTPLISADTQQISTKKLAQATKRAIAGVISLGCVGVSAATLTNASSTTPLALPQIIGAACLIFGGSFSAALLSVDYPETTAQERDIAIMNEWSKFCGVAGLVATGAVVFAILKNSGCFAPAAVQTITPSAVATHTTKATETAMVDVYCSDQYFERLARAMATVKEQAKPALDVTPLLI